MFLVASMIYRCSISNLTCKQDGADQVSKEGALMLAKLSCHGFNGSRQGYLFQWRNMFISFSKDFYLILRLGPPGGQQQVTNSHPNPKLSVPQQNTEVEATGIPKPKYCSLKFHISSFISQACRLATVNFTEWIQDSLVSPQSRENIKSHRTLLTFTGSCPAWVPSQGLHSRPLQNEESWQDFWGRRWHDKCDKQGC